MTMILTYKEFCDYILLEKGINIEKNSYLKDQLMNLVDENNQIHWKKLMDICLLKNSILYKVASERAQVTNFVPRVSQT